MTRPTRRTKKPKRVQTPEKTPIWTEYLPLSEIKKFPSNPKLHEFDALDRSYERFGYVAPMLVDERTGQLVSGNGRLEGLLRRKAEGKPAPERVVVRDGEWFAPVTRGIRFKDDEEAKAYLFADNRLTELGGWDPTKTKAMFDSIPVELQTVSGWSQEAVDKLVRGNTRRVAFDVSQAPEAPPPKIVVECRDEQERTRLLIRFEAEGLRCRPA